MNQPLKSDIALIQIYFNPSDITLKYILTGIVYGAFRQKSNILQFKHAEIQRLLPKSAHANLPDCGRQGLKQRD